MAEPAVKLGKPLGYEMKKKIPLWIGGVREMAQEMYRYGHWRSFII